MGFVAGQTGGIAVLMLGEAGSFGGDDLIELCFVVGRDPAGAQELGDVELDRRPCSAATRAFLTSSCSGLPCATSPGPLTRHSGRSRRSLSLYVSAYNPDAARAFQRLAPTLLNS
jgi:hypothetical protein